jgi:hypothetical protein
LSFHGSLPTLSRPSQSGLRKLLGRCGRHYPALLKSRNDILASQVHRVVSQDEPPRGFLSNKIKGADIQVEMLDMWIPSANILFTPGPPLQITRLGFVAYEPEQVKQRCQEESCDLGKSS